MRPLETYSHLFLECPSYAAAVDWLLDLWQHLSDGTRPPRTARVLVADELHEWPDAPADKPRRLLWTALRLTVLSCIWAARCSPDARQRTSAAVVRAAIRELRVEMLLAHTRAFEERAVARELPPAVLRSRPTSPKAAALDVWLASGLCELPAADDPLPPPPLRGLRVLLSESAPVPAPV